MLRVHHRQQVLTDKSLSKEEKRARTTRKILSKKTGLRHRKVARVNETKAQRLKTIKRTTKTVSRQTLVISGTKAVVKITRTIAITRIETRTTRIRTMVLLVRPSRLLLPMKRPRVRASRLTRPSTYKNSQKMVAILKVPKTSRRPPVMPQVVKRQVVSPSTKPSRSRVEMAKRATMGRRQGKAKPCTTRKNRTRATKEPSKIMHKLLPSKCSSLSSSRRHSKREVVQHPLRLLVLKSSVLISLCLDLCS